MPGEPAFTTTPLFHVRSDYICHSEADSSIIPQGGSADFLRSMNAISTLYLFSSLYSMTVQNVLGAMSVCPDACSFLSVPYILKMVAESPEGLKMLRRMDLVSTGGAPLPEAGK